MMCGWTDGWENDPHARGIMSYFLSPTHRKQVGEIYQETRRDPVPELLIGDPDQMAAFLRHQRVKKKFSVLVLTFEKDDVNTTDFNLGVGGAREAIGRVLSMVLAVSYAGVPERSRPPVLIGTHTHTGRLELNCILPRSVLAGHGRWMGFNPKPPRKLFGDLWDDVVRCVNARFGWADPFDPTRAQLVKLPNWRQKQRAEAKRTGVHLEEDLGERIARRAQILTTTSSFSGRDELLNAMSGWLRKEGIVVAGKSSKTVAFRLRVDHRSVPVKLGGILFARLPYPDFGEAASPPDMPKLAKSVNRNAAGAISGNINKYGKNTWPVPRFDIDEILEGPPLPIPTRHVLDGRDSFSKKPIYNKAFVARRLEALLLKCAQWIEENRFVHMLVAGLNEGPLQVLEASKKKWDIFNAKYNRSAADPAAGCLSEAAIPDRLSGETSGGARGEHTQRTASGNDHDSFPDFGADRTGTKYARAHDGVGAAAGPTRRPDEPDDWFSERPERLSFQRPERGSRGLLIRRWLHSSPREIASHQLES